MSPRGEPAVPDHHRSILSEFFTQRWRGLVGWRTLFWRDLLVIGTSMNLLMTGSALALLMGVGSASMVALRLRGPRAAAAAV